MSAASGVLTYAAASGTIESVVAMELRRTIKFDGDRDDLAQEIRMAAIKALPRFDASRIGDSAFKFLQRCARNHLFNMNRGVHVPNNPPCNRCPLWDKQNSTCKIDEVGCDAIKKYRANMAAKASLRAPDRLPDNRESMGSTANPDIAVFELDDSIRNALPFELIPAYELMANGRADLVESSVKVKVRKIVRKVLAEDRDG